MATNMHTSSGKRTTKNLSKKDKRMIELHAQGMPLYKAGVEVGYSEGYARSAVYRRFKEPPAQEYYKSLQEQILQDASLSCKWFLERCMRTFDNCSELIDDGKMGKKVRDAAGAARMAAIIKDAIPDFKTRMEHTVKQIQTISIGDQEITFE